jgi:FlgD Ig-like domain
MRLILLLITLISSNCFSQNWSTPVVIGNSNYATLADIALDSNNLLHVVFEVDENSDHEPDDIYYTFYDGSQWIPQINISNTDTSSLYPDIRVDKENSIYVIWRDPDYFFAKDIYFTIKKNGKWSQPETLFHTQNDEFPFGDIIYNFDRQNRMHLILFQMPYLYCRSLENNIFTDIKVIQKFAREQHYIIHNDLIYLTFSGMSFSGVTSIYFRSFPVDSVAIDSSRVPDKYTIHSFPEQKSSSPQIVVDSNGRIHIIWLEDTDINLWPDEIYHSFSDDGINWSEAIDITHNGGTSFIPSIVLDSKNNLHLVWAQSLYKSSLQTDHISYVFYDGESWTEPEKILSPTNGWPHMAIDSEDYLHMVYNVKLEGEHKVVYSTTSPVTDVIHRKENNQPKDYRLFQNYPNPFNASTIINFSVPSAEEISLTIFNINGEVVNKLIKNNIVEEGQYQVTWNGKDEAGKIVASGVYLYQIKTNNFTQTKKLIVML